MTDLRKAAEMALEYFDCAITHNEKKVKAALKEALAQPEQEPVAWIFDKRFLLHEANATTFKESPELYTPLYLHPSPIPEGWQLVPIEPTEEMRDAGYWAIRINGGEGDDDVVTQDALKAYEAMLAAAPKPEDV